MPHITPQDMPCPHPGKEEKLADFLAQFDTDAWMMTSPHFLYTDPAGAIAYEEHKQQTGNGSFHSKLAQLFNKGAEEICAHIGKPFTLMEFGPGDQVGESQALAIAAASSPCGSLDWFGIDRNKEWVGNSAGFMKVFSRKAYGHHGDFESSWESVPADFHPTRVAMINLTYMNFPSADILDMLKRAAGKDGYILIAQELITPQNDISSILQHYDNPHIQRLAFGPLGREQVKWTDVDYDLRFANKRVEAGYIFREPHAFKSDRNQIKIKRNNRIVTIRSERRTEKEFEQDLRGDNEIETVLTIKEPGDDTVVKLLRVNAPQP